MINYIRNIIVKIKIFLLKSFLLTKALGKNTIRAMHTRIDKI